MTARCTAAVVTVLVALATVVETRTLPQRGNRPRVSPRATVEAEIDRSRISMEYGRPSKRDRVIWGALVPWGHWWMPGADETTSIRTTETLVFGEAADSPGRTLTMPAGEHTIYTLPAEDVFTLIINKETGQFHTVYHPEQDLGRVTMTKEAVADPVEQLTFVVEPRASGGGVLKLVWDDRQYVVPFVVKPSGALGGIHRPMTAEAPARPVLIGVPYDASSSFLRGAAAAPPRIREALFSPAGNAWAERMVQTACAGVLDDRGDLALPETADVREIIADAVAGLAAEGRPFIALGGDHSITYPILRGLAPTHRSLTVLQIDAHPDLYDEYAGDRYSHACPFARIMEEQLARRLVQVGIRAMTAHGRDQARRFDVEQIDMRSWADGARPSTAGAVYVSIDLDGIDPAFAPGVAHREPGGLTVREVLTILDTLGGELVGADIVEFNPQQDISGITAVVAAKLVKELAAQFMVQSD